MPGSGLISTALKLIITVLHRAAMVRLNRTVPSCRYRTVQKASPSSYTAEAFFYIRKRH